MYIADAIAVKHWTDVVKLHIFVYEDKEFELEKENIWHSIKKACINGQYETTYLSTLNGDKAERLAIVFKGYGYDVKVTQAGYFTVSWRE